ncbi:jg25955, partial [Pararge aegeria aegeria]
NKKTNWEIYQDKISSQVNLKVPLKTEQEIEQNVEHLNVLIHIAAQESTPTLKNTETKGQPFPKVVKEQVTKRRNLRKIWHQSRYPSDKKAFNIASKKLKNLIKTFANDVLQSHLARLAPTSSTDYSLWKATRKMKRPSKHIPPIKKRNGTWARSNIEKAIEYAEYLESVFKPHESSDLNHDDEVRSYLQTPLQMSLPLNSCSPKEVIRAIKDLKGRKAPGYDQIDDKLLRKLPQKGLMLLVIIFNACIRLGHFPSQWKIAQVVMVPKPGKSPQKTSSYRPISLLPVVGKLFERIVLNRLLPYLQEIIPTHQFGFRPKHNTVEQIHRLVDVISRTLENKQYCSAAFIDIGQAFDKVWHDGLLYKIKKL